jgi:hypothetical protein
MPEAFFHRDGDRYVPTELTRGPWSAEAQHGGPPAALLGTVLERTDRREGAIVVSGAIGTGLSISNVARGLVARRTRGTASPAPSISADSSSSIPS